jgi:signal peptidase I
MLIQISITDILLINPSEPVTIIKFLGETIIPLLAISLFASYLAYYGGAIASISYLAVIKSFEMYSPILSDIDWLIKSFIYIIVPTIGFLLIQSSIQETTLRTRLSRKLKRNKDPTLSWLALAVAVLFIVLFSFGYFGVQPSIISSGSMSPALETGDIVVIDEIDISEIKIGDIIQYEMNGFDTVHRVYNITEDDNGKIISESKHKIDFSIKDLDGSEYDENGNLIKSKNYEYEYKYDKNLNWKKKVIYKVVNGKRKKYQVLTRKIKYEK